MRFDNFGSQESYVVNLVGVIHMNSLYACILYAFLV